MKSTNQQSLKHENDWVRNCFFALQTGEITDSEKQRLDEWLAASAKNREAFQELQFIWNNFGELAAEIEAEAEQEQPLLQEGRITAKEDQVAKPAFAPQVLRGFFQAAAGRPLRSSVALAALVLAIFLVVPKGHDTEQALHYLTTTGEVRNIDLADGSQVVLGAESEVSIHMAGETRRVALVEGEAFFSVKPQQEPPFLVSVDNLTIEVIGTRFDVRKRTSGVSIAVAEGEVNVMDESPMTDQRVEARAVVLTAGQKVLKPENQPFDPVENIAASEAGAWRNGWLIYRDNTLKDVLNDANRYFDGRITLRADELSEQKVTLTIRTNQVTRLPDMLAQALPISVKKTPGNQFFLDANPAGNSGQ